MRSFQTRCIALLTCLFAGLPAIAAAQSGPFVDLNGDGNGDVFAYNSATGAWSRQVTLGQGGFTTTQGSWLPGWTVTPVNFNTDSLTDFFLFNPSSGQWMKMINDGAGFTTQSAGTWWPGWERHAMSLDGDVVTDLFLYDPATGVWFKCISTPGGFVYTQGGWDPAWEIHRMTLSDDTLDDLFLINRSSGRWFWALGADGADFTYPETEIWFPGWRLYPGDFNGDGLTDLVLHDPPTGTYFVATTNGSGFTYEQGGWSPGWTPHVADLDGDAKEDLLLHDRGTGHWFEMISDGAGAFTSAGGETWSLGWQIYPIDFNGNGRVDFLLYDAANGAWYQAWNETPGTFTYTAGQLQDGLGISTVLTVTSPPDMSGSCLVTTGDLTIGNTTLGLNGCGAAVGGDLTATNVLAKIVGSPTPPVNVAGSCFGFCGAMGQLTEGSASPVDPLASVPAPANPGGCVAGVAATLNPGCYTSIAATVTTLNPGIYYVTGPVEVGDLSGTNVMIYLAGSGRLTAGNNKLLSLTAPKAGPYRGVAVFQDRVNSNVWALGSNLSLSVSGAIYIPAQDANFANSVVLGNTGCTFLLGRSITLSNATGTLSGHGCAAAYSDVPWLSPRR